MFENIKSWWSRNREIKSFARSFAQNSYLMARGDFRISRLNRLKTKIGQQLLEACMILYDELLIDGKIMKYFRYDRDPRMAGVALSNSFFGVDFCWVGVTRHKVDISEPLEFDEFAMNEEMLNKFREFINSVDIDDEIYELSRGAEEKLNEYFIQHAASLEVFEEGERVLFFYDLIYGISDEGEVFFGLSEIAPFREIIQKVYWKEVNLPFYAWDVGLAEGPVDA